jgi:hypothetical protein
MIRLVNQRDALSVNEQPMVSLHVWRVVEAVDGECYILAMMPSGAQRLTSALVSFDPLTRTARTRSGRCYEFLREPTSDEFVCAVFEQRLIYSNLQVTRDVSDAMWQEILARKQ